MIPQLVFPEPSAGLADMGHIGRLGFDIRDMEGMGESAKIKRIAVQFEEMLIQSMLKSGFGEKNGDEEAPLLTFGPVRDFRTLLMSQHIADSGGLGYRQLIEEQIRATYLGE